MFLPALHFSRVTHFALTLPPSLSGHLHIDHRGVLSTDPVAGEAVQDGAEADGLASTRPSYKSARASRSQHCVLHSELWT